MVSDDNALKKLGSGFTRVLLAIAVVLVVLEFIVHRHGEVALEDIPLFPAIYGFLAFVLIVYAGRALRLVIMRREDFYDD
ncbi:hypothetical protein N9E91_04920 [Alphaproteobacteria bacterium]|jgi:hypothetical protein|nr:hypothetical protein [SAR116 cluster bacterium]MDA9930568.1 hypothetical protein [Alphaproteobacteria bacterium]